MNLPAPRVVMGMPVYQPGAELESALDGLLHQRYAAYRVVLVDDASTDSVTRAALDGIAKHPRVTVRRNPLRLGLAANWNATFRFARELYPEAELFAWAGHHDVWDENWLGALVARIDRNPNAVLAYPLDARIGADGSAIDEPTPRFSTTGERDPLRRLAVCAHRACAGSAIYGLVRVASLERAGAFDVVLRPDRLALAKLSVLGEFEQEPAVLWRRRITAEPTLRRQRNATFPHGRRLVSFLPWPIAHGAMLAWWLVRLGPTPVPLGQAVSAGTTYVARLVARDTTQWVLDRLVRLERRLPGPLPALLRRVLTRAPQGR